MKSEMVSLAALAVVAIGAGGCTAQVGPEPPAGASEPEATGAVSEALRSCKYQDLFVEAISSGTPQWIHYVGNAFSCLPYLTPLTVDLIRDDTGATLTSENVKVDDTGWLIDNYSGDLHVSSQCYVGMVHLQVRGWVAHTPPFPLAGCTNY
jgi:hypothetical protein